MPEEGWKTMLAIDRILVPIDFSEHSELALAHALELARTYDAQLVLVHVVEDPSFPSFYGVGAVTLYGKTPDLEQRAHNALKAMATDLAEEDVSVETHVRKGRAASSILTVVDEHDIDMVVIASRGLSGVERVLLGSVAAKVTRRSPCPVLVVKSITTSLVPDRTPGVTASEAAPS